MFKDKLSMTNKKLLNAYMAGVFYLATYYQLKKNKKLCSSLLLKKFGYNDVL